MANYWESIISTMFTKSSLETPQLITGIQGEVYSTVSSLRVLLHTWWMQQTDTA